MNLLDQCEILLTELDALLGDFEPMTGDEVRRTPRLTRRLERALPELAQLCADLTIDRIANETVSGMLDSSGDAQRTRLTIELLDRIRARLDARRMRAETRTTKAASRFYAVLRTMAQSDDSVRARLVPVSAAYARRRRR